MSITPSDEGDPAEVRIHTEANGAGHRVSNMQNIYNSQHKNGVAGVVTGVVGTVIAPMKDPLWFKGANAYATKKTVITALLTITLLTSTAGQLKSLMRVNPLYPFYNTVLGLLITSILLEIAAGIILFFVGRYNVLQEDQRARCELLNNALLGIAVILLILNIMISAFGIEELQYFPPGYFQYTNTYPTVTVRTTTTAPPIPTVAAVRWSFESNRTF
ncbi:uncharacterized protein LOC129582689 [Paramacrobiotus metropolitanus]|uniref:uncharacterized protein LOC129582689 n=1 Tax=Paramacrobiotus metropolitanus TaxID=2943436 RepID=UPI002445CA5A|nr:uncharacterized protein LOC129582689 [Paramacrobiotus metropolitanus]